MTWTVDFYEEEDGSAPVEQFLARLPRKHRAKALAIVKLLEEMGPTLPFPHSSQVRGKIRELRTQQGKDKIRILYFADERRWFILLHGLIKRTDKLSQNDIATAEQRMNKHNRTSRRTPKQKSQMRAKKEAGPETDIELEVLREENGKVWFRLPNDLGEMELESRLEEHSIEIRGRIGCGPFELSMYPDPDGGGTTKCRHQCEDPDDCIMREVRRCLGLEHMSVQ